MSGSASNPRRWRWAAGPGRFCSRSTPAPRCYGALAGVTAGLGLAFWAALAAAAFQLAWQAARVDTDNPADCLGKFRSNRAVGWLLFAGIIAGHFA